MTGQILHVTDNIANSQLALSYLSRSAKYLTNLMPSIINRTLHVGALKIDSKIWDLKM